MDSTAVNDLPVRAERGAWMMRAAYPLLWLWLLVCAGLALNHPDQVGTITAVKGFVVFAFLFALELSYPLDPRWGITWKFFLRRDAVLAAVNMGTTALITYGLLVLAIGTAETREGVMTGQPLWLQVACGLLVFELLQYTVHRCMHLSGGPVTRFLWRTHAIHHLPQQLYLIMHIVFHPLNLVIVRLVVQLSPVWLLGFDPMAVYLYGSVTFRYTPGIHPAALGLSEADGYPGQTHPVASLLFPFRTGPVTPDRTRVERQKAKNGQSGSRPNIT